MREGPGAVGPDIVQRIGVNPDLGNPNRSPISVMDRSGERFVTLLDSPDHLTLRDRRNWGRLSARGLKRSADDQQRSSANTVGQGITVTGDGLTSLTI
jgi:hypothetical protein